MASTAFEKAYNALFELKKTSSNDEYCEALKSFLGQHQHGSTYNEITRVKNSRILDIIQDRLVASGRAADDETVKLSYCAATVLLESKVGIEQLFNDEFLDSIHYGLQSFAKNKKIMVQIVILLQHLIYLKEDVLYNHCLKTKIYDDIINYLVGSDECENKANEEKDEQKGDDALTLEIVSGGIRIIAYLTINKDDAIRKAVYENDDFFEWLFTQFMKWTANEAEIRVHHGGIDGICEIVLNFDMYEGNVIESKLDDKVQLNELIKRVVVNILSLPLDCKQDRNVNFKVPLSRKQREVWKKEKVLDYPLMRLKVSAYHMMINYVNIVTSIWDKKFYPPLFELIYWLMVAPTDDKEKRDRIVMGLIEFATDAVESDSSFKDFVQNVVLLKKGALVTKNQMTKGTTFYGVLVNYMISKQQQPFVQPIVVNFLSLFK